MSNPVPLTPDEVTAILRYWRQGDCALKGDLGFVHRFSLSCPLTAQAKAVEDSDVDLVEDAVIGFSVVTQTCDLVRDSESRPYVEVVPLVAVDEADLQLIRKGQQPSFAYVPGVAARSLVADLGRVMTVEKSVVAGWDRVPGCTDDQQIHNFQFAVVRKRRRFAFPDDFTECAGRLQGRLKGKHGKGSAEGDALRALDEIRVRAEPNWDAAAVSLFFWFVRSVDQEDINGSEWATHCEKWLKLVKRSGRFVQVEGVVSTLMDMTAQDYVDSVPLDLDQLSLSQ
jgi:hypothetical protein